MEAVLWILAFLVFVAIAKESAEKTERTTWSDEKLEARKRYLLYHESNSDEWMKINDEQNRRITERLKADAKSEWEKYK